MHLLEDVAAGPDLAELGSPIGGQAPGGRRDALGELEVGEVLQAGRQEGRVGGSARGVCRAAYGDDAVHGAALDVAIEGGEAVLADLSCARALDVERGARAEILGGKLLGARAQAAGDVSADRSERGGRRGRRRG